MNIKNLPLKFTILAGLIALAIIALATKKIKYGIDINGGHSMTFEIKSNAPEIKNIEATIAELEAQLKTKPEDKATIQPQIDDAKARVKGLREVDSSSDLREQIIKTLKERIDRNGLLNLEWIPQQNNRIEIRMPAARKETEVAKNAYLEAISDIEKKNIQVSSIKLAIDDPANRDARIDNLVKSAGGGDKLSGDIRSLIPQHDKIAELSARLANLTATAPAATQPEDINKRRNNLKFELDVLEEDYSKAIDALLATYNINVPQFETILKLYVSDVEKEALGNSDEVKTRTEEFQDRMKTFMEVHSTRKAEIEQATALYKQWVGNRLLLDDPSDLKRLIAKVGVLEFRIAPMPGDKNGPSAEDVVRYKQELKEKGPETLNRKGGKFMWFPIRSDRESYGYLYTGEYGAVTYVLLYNTPDYTMLQRGGSSPWSLENARPDSDNKGLPAIEFQFDPRGAAIFRSLTSSHLKQPMAILLDNEVYSAPTIQSTISDRGQITGKFTRAEVDELVRILKAGSLPAKLNPVPVSESTFGPALGQQNLDQAAKAGLACLIVIVAFMTLYYFLAGCVANFAMMLNLLFVLGAMSWLSSVFTLPGIAGLILSIGMAVDANVLIYERLREEQDKGQSPRMSLKNAYERAFSAIFDSNITTLISCLILGWVGSEEIRGFAITLGLGVLFNLFTAVTVTKWIFQVMLDTGMVKKRFSMLRLIGVPKIDWMGKRYYFWAFSLITGILGLAAFVSIGKDILGIEFSAGTQAIVRMKDDATLKNKSGAMNLPDEKLVENLIKAKAEKFRKENEKLRDNAATPQQKQAYQDAIAGYAKIEDGRVERLLDPKHFTTFWDEHFKAFTGEAITREDWKKANLNEQMFDLMDKDKTGRITKKDIEAALADKSSGYQLTTTESDLALIRKVVREAFETSLNIRMKSDYKLVKGSQNAAGGTDKFANKIADGLGTLLPDGPTKIDRKLIAAARNISAELSDYEGGVLIVIKDVNPSLTVGDLKQRIRLMRTQPDQKDQSLKPTNVLGLDRAGENTFSSFAVMVRPNESLENDADAWKKFAEGELNLVNLALSREEAIEATNFDPALAGAATQAAIMALVLGWLAIIVYLWVRFGQARWGLAAVLCLMHDVMIIVGLVAVSNWVYDTSIGKMLMIQPFKIDLTMIAALLTIIGYSVNDTIVVFDRIRENRGKLATVTPAIINASINQTLSRTLLTAGTVFIVVFIMYVWGGSGLHAFNYALLIGVLFGTYSSIAVAAPMLLGFKGMMFRSLDAQAGQQAGK